MISKNSKITNLNEFKVGDVFLVDNKPEIALASKTPPLLVVARCTKELTDNQYSHEKVEFIDVHLIYGDTWHDVWEANKSNLENTWNFYPITNQTHPEYFL